MKDVYHGKNNQPTTAIIKSSKVYVIRSSSEFNISAELLFVLAVSFPQGLWMDGHTDATNINIPPSLIFLKSWVEKDTCIREYSFIKGWGNGETLGGGNYPFYGGQIFFNSCQENIDTLPFF